MISLFTFPKRNATRDESVAAFAQLAAQFREFLDLCLTGEEAGPGGGSVARKR